MAVTQLFPDLGAKGHRSYRLLRTVLGGTVRRFEADLADPEAAQQRRFVRVARGMAGTQFARDHGINGPVSLSEFQQTVPIRTAEEYSPYLEAIAQGQPRVVTRKAPTMLVETSGTTRAPKRLPVTPDWAESVQLAQRLWTLALVRDHPEVAGGKAFTFVSPAVHGRSEGGLPIGSNTGRIRAAQPFWLRSRYAVPREVMDIEDPVARQYAALRFGLAADVRSITTANPSLVLLLFRRVAEWEGFLRADLHDGTLARGPAQHIPPALRTNLERRLSAVEVPPSLDPCEVWNLETVNCWTNGPAAYFADRLRARLGPVPVREVGIRASEGCIAFPLSADWPGSALWVGGHLLEFVLDGGDVVGVHELEEGMTARVVLSTTAGLYRYDLGDRVEVVARCLATPVVRFLGKAGRFLNALGERVSEDQVSASMAATGAMVQGFTVRVKLGDVPEYDLVFEGNCEPSALAQGFDRALAQCNVEYASKRASGRLGAPVARRLEAGHYARLRAHMVQNGAPSGQLKDPVIAIDDAEWQRASEVRK